MQLEPHLKTRVLGRNFIFRHQVSSTNTVAAELAALGMPEGTVVCADTQTAGRGRQRRRWHSPPGRNLYFSVLLRPRRPLAEASQMALVAGLAVVRGLESLPEAPRGADGAAGLQLKWPNDIFLGGRKLCGILCEMPSWRPRPALVVGIGINLALGAAELPAELQDRAISLQEAWHLEVPRAEALAAVLGELEALYAEWQAHGLEPLLPALGARSSLLGRPIVAETPAGVVEGTAVGILPSGNLAIRLADGSAAEIAAGDVHLRGGPGRSA